MKPIILLTMFLVLVACSQLKAQETQSLFKARFDSCRAINPYSLHSDTYSLTRPENWTFILPVYYIFMTTKKEKP